MGKGSFCQDKIINILVAYRNLLDEHLFDMIVNANMVKSGFVKCVFFVL